jgi:NADPH:quinone reductase-like Zn-dependent oxidoreductase
MTSQVPTTQQAWVAVRKGLPSEALEFRVDYPVPNLLADGEVLVKVQAAALNPV